LRAPVARDVARGFFAADARLAPVPADLVRVEAGFFAPPVERVLVLRVAVDLRAVERFAAVLRAAGLRRAVPVLAAACARPPESSSLHLPDMTRCAASATASAMIEPSLVALLTMFVAAADAVSAASSPASRILRRAAGLALIAAAAAARPAASISLLIAALASLSIVSDALDFEDDLEEVFFVDLAITRLPPFRR
jgi:hypothetical protein